MRRTAFGLLGLTFALLLLGAYFFVERAHAPVSERELLEGNDITMLSIVSSVFDEGGTIPSKYTCDGENISPPLTITGVPEGAQSVVLVMDDPDIPDFVKERMGIEVFDHWVVTHLAPEERIELKEGLGAGEAAQGKNSAGNLEYTGPCPPDREHRYFFRVYALDTALNFVSAPTAREIQDAIEGHILEEAQLMGKYERINQ